MLRTPRSLYIAVFGTLVICLVSLGCSGGSEKLPPMAPVAGKVMLDNQPLGAGQVTLMPEAQTKVGLSAGTIDADGSFKIFTAGKEGAPLGKYKVMVSPSMVPTGDTTKGGMAKPTFAAKYFDVRQTPLKIEVTENHGPYDLKVTKK
jgi:hypothetical protein